MTHLIHAAAIVAAMTLSPAHADDVTVRPVLAEKLPNVPGKSVTMVRVTIASGASPAPHHHAGAVAVYVLGGTITSKVGDAPLKTYKAGDTFFEPPGAQHAVSSNPSPTEPVELLAVFVADDGATLTTNDK